MNRTRYDFYWSPEGRKVASYEAESRGEARQRFKREHKDSYAQFMGEVYVVEERVP